MGSTPEHLTEGARAGEFVWIDLRTRQPTITQRFYRALFGWRFREIATDISSYTAFYVGDAEAGQISALASPILPDDASPHVGCYVAVDSIHPIAEQAVSLGGMLLSGPRVGDLGLTATVQDPTGGVLSLWQPGTFRGSIAPASVPGAPVMYEPP